MKRVALLGVCIMLLSPHMIYGQTPTPTPQPTPIRYVHWEIGSDLPEFGTSSEQPWQTLSYACQSAPEDSWIWVAPCSYTSVIDIPSDGTSGLSFMADTNGVIWGEQTWAVLDGGRSAGTLIKAYLPIEVNGFILQGNTENMVEIRGTADGSILRNCQFIHNASHAYGKYIIYLYGADNSVVEDCYIEATGYTAYGLRGRGANELKIRRNQFDFGTMTVASNALWFNGCDDSLVEENSINAGNIIGYTLGWGSSPGCIRNNYFVGGVFRPFAIQNGGLFIYNNIIDCANRNFLAINYPNLSSDPGIRVFNNVVFNGVSVFAQVVISPDTRIYNNIFYDFDNVVSFSSTTSNDTKLSYNCFWQVDTDSFPSICDDGNNIYLNPFFSQTGDYDGIYFMIGYGSPCFGAGTDAYEIPTYDFKGTPYPDPISMGAFAGVTATKTPCSPTPTPYPMGSIPPTPIPTATSTPTPTPSPTPYGYKTPPPTPPTPSPTPTPYGWKTPTPTPTPSPTPEGFKTPTPIPQIYYRTQSNTDDCYVRIVDGETRDVIAQGDVTTAWKNFYQPPSESRHWYCADFAFVDHNVFAGWKRYDDSFQILEWALPSPTPSTTPTSTTTPSLTPTATPTMTPSPTKTPYHVIVDWDDYNGDGTTDIAMYRPGSFEWLIQDYTTFTFGTDNCIPAPGDYDGDGCADPAYVCASGWYLMDITEGVVWGQAGDIPVPGDYDGDGFGEIGVYRPDTGYWYIKDVTTRKYGGNQDFPVPGDYDGDGTTDLAYYHATAANSYWYTPLGVTNYGYVNDVPAPLDINGDGTTDLATWRSANGWWFIRNQTKFIIGKTGDMPITGDFNGDGSIDCATWNSASTLWSISYQNLDSETVTFGSATDIPAVGITY